MRRKFGLVMGVSLLTVSLVTAQQRSPKAIFKRFDRNNDGRLEKSELPRPIQARFATMDLDKNGSLSLKELEKAFAARTGGGRNPRRPGEVNTPPARGERHRDQLKTGELAPDFTLPTIHGKNEIQLSSFRNKRPVVLIFGSYT